MCIYLKENIKGFFSNKSTLFNATIALKYEIIYMTAVHVMFLLHRKENELCFKLQLKIKLNENFENLLDSLKHLVLLFLNSM